MALDKERIRYAAEDENCLPGGTKEAGLILHCAEKPGRNGVFLNDRETEALWTLIAASSDQKDTVPEMWQCDSDCCHVYEHLCPGEMHVNNKAKIMCPHYVTEDK